VDHTTDAITQILIFCGLGLTANVSFNIACLALASYLVMCIVTYLRTAVSREFKISYVGLGPTESRVVAVLLNTAMHLWGIRTITFKGQTFSVYDLAVLGVAMVLFGIFFNTAWQETRRLADLGK
jgi:archaetidylinositol phosphate synthase